MQDYGCSHEDGCSRYRYQRLGRCTYSGRYQRPRWLLRNLPAQHHGIRCDSPDFRYLRSLRRWCRILTCPHRLHLDDGRHFIHVPHRSRRSENRTWRRRYSGAARWRISTLKQVRCDPLHRTDRGRGSCHDPQAPLLHAPEQHGAGTPRSVHRPHRP